MPKQQTSETTNNELAIIRRLLNGKRGSMAPSLARHVLTLGFSDADQARMADLAERNQEGALSAAELKELAAFVKAGHLLALLHAQARQALTAHRVS